MQTQIASQKNFAQAVESLVNVLPSTESYLVLCLCQARHSDFFESCNQYFVFPISGRAQALPEVMEWATAIQNVNLMEANLRIFFYWDIISQLKFEAVTKNGSEDPFLTQAAAAMLLQEWGVNNPYLSLGILGFLPKYSDLLNQMAA